MNDQSTEFAKLRAQLAATLVAGLNAGEREYENPVELALNQADAIMECCGLEKLEAIDSRD